MYASQTVLGYLDKQGIDFDLVSHRHSVTSAETARSARIEPKRLAKAVLVSDESDYILAVIPASRRLNRWALERLIDAAPLQLAAEQELPLLFRDCERGALPAVGDAFGLATAVDDALLATDEVYFEAGDHEHLVRVSGAAFARMMASAAHGKISHGI